MLNSTIGLPCATSWLSPPAIESPVIEVATPSAPDANRSCTIFSCAAGSKPGVPWILTLTPRSLPASRAACSTCLMNGLPTRSEEHTSELQSPDHLVCRLLLEKKKKQTYYTKNHTYIQQLIHPVIH